MYTYTHYFINIFFFSFKYMSIFLYVYGFMKCLIYSSYYYYFCFNYCEDFKYVFKGVYKYICFVLLIGLIYFISLILKIFIKTYFLLLLKTSEFLKMTSSFKIYFKTKKAPNYSNHFHYQKKYEQFVLIINYD